ncbi:AsmA family protein [Salinisphaera aquimarina]|uniref:AsmA family protein n=1 Tax=Salinisphaera aquimarina TaxID=2094031 RepID=A0ABV7EPC4_9GAMM
MKRGRKIGIGIGGLIVVVLVVVVLLLTFFDWNRVKPMINEQVSAALHRPFAIRGDLGLDWERQRDAGGFKAWVPWPHVHAEDVMLGNPESFDEKTMATVKRVDVWLSPLPLLSQRVSIPRIQVAGADADLIRRADGKDNWTFDLGSEETPKEDAAPSAWTVSMDALVFDQGNVHFQDATLDADFEIQVDPLGKAVPFSQITGAADDDADVNVGDYVFGWKIDGRYKGAPLSGSGKLGGVLAMQSADQPFPVQADVRSGSTRVQVAGTITQPLNFGGADLDLSFSGQSLDNLYALTGITLPATPPYSTHGHLQVKFDTAKGSRFAYRDFGGQIGDSDIGGTLVYDQAGARPKLSGDVVSKQLRFADLAPLIGADSNEHKEERGVESRQPADKVLPVEEFNTERWSDMDADVKFRAKRIEHGDTLPLTDLHTHLVLNDGTLLLDPLSFGVAGGNLNTTLRLSGNESPMKGRVDLHARRMQLDQMVPAVEALDGSLGQINGDATFSGTGNSVAALLGGGDGRLTVLINRGAISRNLMELAGLNVGNFIVGKLFGDEQVKINCAAADIPIKKGLATPNVFVFDTENAIINITGDTDFATEDLDLTITPKSKGPRLFTLRSPLYVHGTFANPSPGVEAKPLLARGAAAVALGVVATPAASLLALISPTSGEENQCAPVLQQIKAAEKKSGGSGS